MFDVGSYMLTDTTVAQAVQSYIDALGEDELIDKSKLIELGVDEETATKMYDDYSLSKSNGKPDTEDDTTSDDVAESSEDSSTTDDTSEKENDDNSVKDEPKNGESDNSTDNTYYKKLYEDLLLKIAIDKALEGITFSSFFAKEGIINKIMENNLELKDNELVGVDEIIEKLREEYPDAFSTNTEKPLFRSTSKPNPTMGSDIATFLAERYKGNPYFK